MPQLNVSASVTSPPSNVQLIVNNQGIPMGRDASGAWAGQKTLILPDPVTIAFGAVGIAGAPWTLEIKFSTLPPSSTVVKDLKHQDTIPNNLLSVFHDTVSLS